MPNHVFCSIQLDSKEDCKLLKKIAKLERGLAEYLYPMPKELNHTSSPATIISEKEYQDQEKKRESGERIWNTGITLEMSNKFKSKYGVDNWYAWALGNWGTKWGCYDNEFHEDTKTYVFTTAWSPLDEELILEFAKLVKGFSYFYEEESGWGGWMEYEDGEFIGGGQYEEPHWDDSKEFAINDRGVIKEMSGVYNHETKVVEYEEGYKFLCEVSYLRTEHTNACDTYEEGWYECYSLNEYYGKTLKEVFEYHCHKDRKGNQPIIFG